MTHISPAVFTMWSVCGALLTIFCFYHIWHYDRFKCLRMNNGPQSGAFKRLMTYSYILTLPLIAIYSLGNAVIKYQEGFVVGQFGVSPKPYTQWTKSHQNAAFPLLMMFSVGFSLEMTTHLEELCFWLFLMNATVSSRDWFRSTYFVIWSCGTTIALIYVPTVTVASRHDPIVNEAYTILAASLGSLSLTLFFVPILYSFPGFLRGLVKQGVDKATMIRLRKFHEMNRLRIAFRLLFVLPLVALGIDGVKPHTHPLNESMFWTDIFGMVSALGCIVSSAITLLIFFPRNDENEYESSSLGRLSRLEASQRKPRQKAPVYYSGGNRSELASETLMGSSSTPHAYTSRALSFASRSEVEEEYGAPPRYQARSIRPGSDHHGDMASKHMMSPSSALSDAPLRPNRLCPNGDVELGGVEALPGVGGSEEWVKHWTSQFKSPLDVMQLNSF